MNEGTRNGNNMTKTLRMETHSKVDLNLTRSSVILNVHGLNKQIKRQRLSDWGEKSKTQLYGAYKKCI